MLSVNGVGPVGLDAYYSTLVGRPDNGARNTVTAAGLETPILAARALPTTSAPALYPADAPVGQTATTRIGSVNVPTPAEQTAFGPNATDAATQYRGISSLAESQQQRGVGGLNDTQQQGGDQLFANLRGVDDTSRSGINAQPSFGLDAETTDSLGALQSAQETQQSAPTTGADPADTNGDGTVGASEAFEYQRVADLGGNGTASPFSNLFGATV